MAYVEVRWVGVPKGEMRRGEGDESMVKDGKERVM